MEYGNLPLTIFGYFLVSAEIVFGGLLRRVCCLWLKWLYLPKNCVWPESCLINNVGGHFIAHIALGYWTLYAGFLSVTLWIGGV